VKKHAVIAGLALFLGGAPFAALCAGSPAGGISFVSGGIGETEQQQLLARQNEYNLKLVFTLTEGNYVADVGVTVKDGAGKTVIEDVAGGPFFLAKLPAGRYSVAAMYDGKTVTRKVEVGGGLHTENFRWAADPRVDFALSSGKD
jgi:hypothetical protein